MDVVVDIIHVLCSLQFFCMILLTRNIGMYSQKCDGFVQIWLFTAPNCNVWEAGAGSAGTPTLWCPCKHLLPLQPRSHLWKQLGGGMQRIQQQGNTHTCCCGGQREKSITCCSLILNDTMQWCMTIRFRIKIFQCHRQCHGLLCELILYSITYLFIPSCHYMFCVWVGRGRRRLHLHWRQWKL